MKLPEIVKAEFLRREKRFLSYHRLPSGEEVVAHCANPGSMRGNAVAGYRTWLQDFGPDFSKNRKLRYRWLVVEAPLTPVCIDTSLGNVLAEEVLCIHPSFAQPAGPFSHIHREVKWGESRFDFLLSPFSDREEAIKEARKGKFVEVKSVSMADSSIALFPDSPTARGQKHMRELQSLVEEGYSAAVLFLVMRSDCTSFAANEIIDPKYAQSLALAQQAGVEVVVHTAHVEEASLRPGKVL